MKPTPRLRLASAPYPIISHIADPDVRGGMDVELVRSEPARTFAHLLSGTGHDAGEMSLVNLMMMASQDDRSLVAIPVFPSRIFRLAMLWVHRDGPVQGPGDLIGRRVGVDQYAMTGPVALRGMLSDVYGVPPTAVEWVRTATERLDFPQPEGITITDSEATSVEDMLTTGEVDAAMLFWKPRARPATIRRLFEDPRHEEMSYYRETGIFPIMHVIVLQSDVYARDPNVAVKLYDLLSRAKLRHYQDICRFPSAMISSSPWAYLDYEETVAVLGDDPFPYGVRENRLALEVAARHAREQGLLTRDLNVDELFAAELLDT